jgi:hypothetical protein
VLIVDKTMPMVRPAMRKSGVASIAPWRKLGINREKMTG